jgi:hypothetical protein
LLVSSPNPDAYVPGNPHHVREFRAHELEALLAPHFPHVSLHRQVNWVTSAILADDDLDGDGFRAIADLNASVVASWRAGSEPYAVLVASDQPVPELPKKITATGLAEPRRWLERYEAQERKLAEYWEDWHRQYQQADRRRRESEMRLAEVLDQADRRVAVLEADRRKVEALLERADRVLADMRRSPSWRITAPLRALKRLRR